MIETLMALWNQDRRKRAKQILLTFLLMCIGISLLFIITNNSIQSQNKGRQSAQRQATATVPSFGGTVVPNLSPTASIVIGTQPSSSSTTTPSTPAVTPTTSVIATPTATDTVPCPATPASVYIQGTGTRQSDKSSTEFFDPNPTKTVHYYDGGGGGGPVGTPVVITPTVVLTTTPGGSPSNHPPGWIPSCTESNSISYIASSSALSVLIDNAWTILGSSFLGTVVLYASIFAVKRRTVKP